MLSTAKNTTETTYEYNDEGKVSKKTVVETGDVAVPTVTTTYCGDDDTEVETGVELESAFGMSPLEVFLTAAAGALVGSLLYRAIRKD